MKIISINWHKAENKPDVKQKVLGRVLLDLRSKINDLEKQLGVKAKELEEVKISINTLTSSEANLKFKLSNAEQKISMLETKVKNSADKEVVMEKTIEHRNQVIEKLEDDFEKRITQIEELKKVNEILNDQLEKSIAAPKLIKKLQNIMLYKGFVADREFNDIMNKLVKKYHPIDFQSV